MNSVVLIGRLTREPEIRYTEAQLAIARLNLAVDRQKAKDKESGADFINIIAFGKTAEAIEKFTDKGKKLAVQGRIQTGSYVNKEGNKVYTTDVIADRVEFLEWKEREEDNDLPAGFEQLDEELPF